MSNLHTDVDIIKLNKFRSFTARTANVPLRIDHRCALLETSNQGPTSECAAFAMAGAIEYEAWKWLGIYQQVDPHPIYVRAKEIDDIDGEGTTLYDALVAAQDLHLIDPIDEESIRILTSPSEVRQAIHRYDVVLAGFNICNGWDNIGPSGWVRRGDTLKEGHAVLLCGYAQDNEQWYAMQGSWGADDYGWRGFVRITPDQFAEQFLYGIVWDYILPRFR